MNSGGALDVRSWRAAVCGPANSETKLTCGPNGGNGSYPISALALAIQLVMQRHEVVSRRRALLDRVERCQAVELGCCRFHRHHVKVAL
jgi:hypothetical protein